MRRLPLGSLKRRNRQRPCVLFGASAILCVGGQRQRRVGPSAMAASAWQWQVWPSPKSSPSCWVFQPLPRPESARFRLHRWPARAHGRPSRSEGVVGVMEPVRWGLERGLCISAVFSSQSVVHVVLIPSSPIDARLFSLEMDRSAVAMPYAIGKEALGRTCAAAAAPPLVLFLGGQA